MYVDLAVTDTDDLAVPGAVVDVRQSDDDGFYDVQLPDLDGPVLRGRLHPPTGTPTARRTCT